MFAAFGWAILYRSHAWPKIEASLQQMAKAQEALTDQDKQEENTMIETQNITTTANDTLSTPKHLEAVPTHLPTVMPRVVIVGAGFGGLQAAKALRKAPVHLTVIDRQNHHVFQPLLYWVATAGLSPADIAAPIRGILRKQH